jgi:hypothetical protein
MEADSLASTGISPPSGFNLQYGTFGDVIELGRAKVMGLEGILYTRSILCSGKALNVDLDFIEFRNRTTEYFKHAYHRQYRPCLPGLQSRVDQ